MQGIWKVKLWSRFKRLSELPAKTKGLERGFGALLYILCLICALGLAIQYLVVESHAHFTNFQVDTSNYQVGKRHVAPDLVLCPVMKKNHGFKYNIAYNYPLIEVLNITIQEVNILAGMFYDTCDKEKCGQLTMACESQKMFSGYCKKVNAIVDAIYTPTYTKKRGLTQEQADHYVTMSKKYGIHRENIQIIMKMKKVTKEWPLQLLFLALIKPGYTLWDDMMLTYDANHSRIMAPSLPCWFALTDGSKEQEFNSRCPNASRTFWLDMNLCSAILGSEMGVVELKFIGFDTIYWLGMTKYWIGSLETQMLSMKDFSVGHWPYPKDSLELGTDRISGVVHYSMIVVNDSTKSSRKCKPQPLLKGAKIPCQRGTPIIRWYYDLSFQVRKLTRIWIYARDKTEILKFPNFTPYTKFQFTASLFGCMVGLSAMSLIEAALTFVAGRMKEGRKLALTLTKGLALLALLSGMVAMTIVDVDIYLKNRYTQVFKEKAVELQTPVVRLCNDFHAQSEPGFINTTRFYDYDVSPGLYSLIKMWAMHQHDDFYMPERKEQFYKNGTFTRIIRPAWMVKNWDPPFDLTPMKDYRARGCYPNISKYKSPNQIIHEYDQWCVYKNKTAIQALVEKRRQEFRVLSQKIGSDGTLADFYRKFLLDPRKFIKRCRVWGQNIQDCGQYASYVYMNSHSMFCLQLAIPDNFRSQKRPGPKDAMEIVLDNAEWKEHSDLNRYVGPGLEAERRIYKEDLRRCMSIKRFVFTKYKGPSNETFKKLCYRTSIGWSFAFTAPTPGVDEGDIRLYPERFTKDRSFTMTIKPGFAKALEGGEGDCVEKPLCYYPVYEFRAVLKGLSMVKVCNCVTCFERTDHFMRDIKRVLGYPANCCTYNQMADCYLKALDEVKYDHKRPWYNPWYPPNRRFLYGYAFLNKIGGGEDVAQRRKAKPEDFKPVFDLLFPGLYSRFDNATKVRLAEFARECYRPVCDSRTITLENVMEGRVNHKDETTFTLIYSTDDAVGTEQIDRLDPSQMLATLVCGYSITFGISLIGMIEILLLMGMKIRGVTRSGNIAKAFHYHFLRTLGVAFKVENKVQPASSAPPIAEGRAGNQSGTSQEIETNENEAAVQDLEGSIRAASRASGESENSESQTVTPAEPLEGKKSGKRMGSPKQGTSESCGEEEEAKGAAEISQPKAASSASMAEEEMAGTSGNCQPQLIPVLPGENSQTAAPQGEQEAENRKSSAQGQKVSARATEEGQQADKSSTPEQTSGAASEAAGIKEKEGPENQKFYQIFMAVALVLTTAAAVLSIVFFVSFTGNVEYNADVQERPIYQKPSSLICHKEKRQFALLKEGLRAAKCWANQKEAPCLDIFSTEIALTSEAFCVMMDNTRSFHRKDSDIVDVSVDAKRLLIPRNTAITVRSFNHTSLSSVIPYITWDSTSIMMEYKADQRMTFFNCTNDIQRLPCPLCPEQLTLDASGSKKGHFRVCCTKKGEEAPSIFPEKACEQFVYGMGMITSPAPTPNSTLSFKVKTSSNYVFYYYVNRKYSAIGWLSLIGGFVGAFVELTILNLLAALIIALLRAVRRMPIC